MSSTRPNTAVFSAVLAAAASIAVLIAMLLLAAPATASDRASGSAAFTMGTGKPGKVLRKGKVRIAPVKPAKARRKGNAVRVSTPISALRLAQTSSVTLRGGLRFNRGSRRAVFTKLRLNVTARRTTVAASLGKRRIVLFRAVGSAVIDPVEARLNLTSARLSLTGTAARLIRGKLRINRLPGGSFGRFSLSARGVKPPVPVVDPFLEQCGLGLPRCRF